MDQMVELVVQVLLIVFQVVQLHMQLEQQDLLQVVPQEVMEQLIEVMEVVVVMETMEDQADQVYLLSQQYTLNPTRLAQAILVAPWSENLVASKPLAR